MKTVRQKSDSKNLRVNQNMIKLVDLLSGTEINKKVRLVLLGLCFMWSPAGKGLTSWLSFVVSTVSLSLSHWYPGSGVVLDCIDS